MHTLLVLFFYFLYQRNAHSGQDRLKYGGAPACALICRIWLKLGWLCFAWSSREILRKQNRRERCYNKADTELCVSAHPAPQEVWLQQLFGMDWQLPGQHSFMNGGRAQEMGVTHHHSQRQALGIKHSSETKLAAWQHANTPLRAKLEKWTECKNRNTQICSETVFLEAITCLVLF